MLNICTDQTVLPESEQCSALTGCNLAYPQAADNSELETDRKIVCKSKVLVGHYYESMM